MMEQPKEHDQTRERISFFPLPPPPWFDGRLYERQFPKVVEHTFDDQGREITIVYNQ